MTVVAVWCRHEGDNLIGIGNNIPWHVPSDKERFLEIVTGQVVVCGRKTYESLPNRVLDHCRIIVMSFDTNYVVFDAVKHRVAAGQKILAELEEDLYIAGGSMIYRLFMTGKEKLKPQVIVDCVYTGKTMVQEGERIDITDSIKVMEQAYRRVSPYYCLDKVKCSIWIRRGEFVEQSVLKRLTAILEKEAEVLW